MFNFIKKTLTQIYQQVSSKLTILFSKKECDEQSLKELELILISADTGVKTTRHIIDTLKKSYLAGKISKGSELKEALKTNLLTLLGNQQPSESSIYLLVGINGSGKTTFAGKLAHTYAQKGKKVLLIAADTFRAAAPEQLTQWAQKVGADIFLGKPGQDPAAVVFQGCQKFNSQNYDILIIDTAGRLQTKINLMKELEKIKRVMSKHFPEKPVTTLLTIDSMLGQNSLQQARLFNQSTQLCGIVLTKMDGTGKGGIVFAIASELQIPIFYISFGEQLQDYKQFKAQEYVTQLLNS